MVARKQGYRPPRAEGSYPLPGLTRLGYSGPLPKGTRQSGTPVEPVTLPNVDAKVITTSRSLNPTGKGVFGKRKR